jgi:hypothetical protein
MKMNIVDEKFIGLTVFQFFIPSPPKTKERVGRESELSKYRMRRGRAVNR